MFIDVHCPSSNKRLNEMLFFLVLFQCLLLFVLCFSIFFVLLYFILHVALLEELRSEAFHCHFCPAAAEHVMMRPLNLWYVICSSWALDNREEFVKAKGESELKLNGEDPAVKYKDARVFFCGVLVWGVCLHFCLVTGGIICCCLVLVSQCWGLHS